MNTTKLQAELNETLRKVGRNVLHFQRMESILKYLVSHSNIEGTAKNLKENHKKNINSVSQKTMGNLVKDMFTSIYSAKEEESPTAEDFDKAIIKISFKVDADPVYVEQKKLALEKIVTERNTLIHQTLSNLDQTSIESCQKLSVTLDEQAERLKPEFEDIRSLAKALHEGTKKAFEAWEKEYNT